MHKWEKVKDDKTIEGAKKKNAHTQAREEK